MSSSRNDGLKKSRANISSDNLTEDQNNEGEEFLTINENRPLVVRGIESKNSLPISDKLSGEAFPQSNFNSSKLSSSETGNSFHINRVNHPIRHDNSLPLNVSSREDSLDLSLKNSDYNIHLNNFAFIKHSKSQTLSEDSPTLADELVLNLAAESLLLSRQPKRRPSIDLGKSQRTPGRHANNTFDSSDGPNQTALSPNPACPHSGAISDSDFREALGVSETQTQKTNGGKVSCLHNVQTLNSNESVRSLPGTEDELLTFGSMSRNLDEEKSFIDDIDTWQDFEDPKRRTERYPALHRARHFTALVISQGSCVRKHCTTGDLLKIVHKQLNQEYHLSSELKGPSIPAGSLKLRDIRQILMSGSDRPSIEARRSCILVNMLNIRALILADRVILMFKNFVNSPPQDNLHTSSCGGQDAVPLSLASPLDLHREVRSGFPTASGQELKLGQNDSPAVQDDYRNQFNEGILDRDVTENKDSEKNQHYNFEIRDQPSIHQPLLLFESRPDNLPIRKRSLLSSANTRISTLKSLFNLYGSKNGRPKLFKGTEGGLPKVDQTSFWTPLITKLTRVSEVREVFPFEFMVLETILVEVVATITEELEPIEKETEQVLKETTSSLSSTRRLHDLRELKSSVHKIEQKIAGVLKAIEEILDSEEDLRRMELSRYWKTPGDWERPGDTPGCEDLEMLLESYEQDCESLLKRVQSQDNTLDMILQIVQLHLSSIRNLLEKFNVGLQVIGIAIASVAAVGGAFGMNIPNGWETNSNIFWPLCRSMFVAVLVIFISTCTVFSKLQL